MSISVNERLKRFHVEQMQIKKKKPSGYEPRSC